MADHAPAAKRAKREKFMFDSSSSDDDDDSVIKNMEMDTTDISDIYTSDNSEDGSFLQSSKRGDGEKLNRKPFVLKVPRGKASVPESVKHPGSALVSDKRKNSISPEQFRALSMMPLDNMCMFAEVSKSFKELALKFFPMKYRNMNLAALANPTTGKLGLFQRNVFIFCFVVCIES